MSKRSSTASRAEAQRSKKAKKQRSLSGFFGAPKSTSLPEEDAAADGSHKVFCDLDGVLVDFDAGVKRLFNGRSPDELNPGRMWSAISGAEEFYARLPWTPDGKALWEELRSLPTPPHILTGVPRKNKSRAEKFAWCQEELGASVNHVDMAGKKSAHELVAGRRKHKPGVVNVITCWSKNKHCESKENHVLIDDRLSLREAWEERGGIFIHHTNTERTLSMLRNKGVLKSNNKPDKEE